MMVGFSCFPTHISCHKTKKEDQQGFQECYSQELHKSSPVLSSDEPIKVTPVSATSILEMEESIPSNMHTNAKQITSPSSSECCWKSEEHNEISYPGNGKEFLWIMSPRKSQSVGSGLDREGRLSCNADTDDEIDQALPLNNFQDENFGGLVNSYGDSGLQEVCGSDDAGINLLNQNQENTFGINVDPLSNGSTFFVEAKKQFDCKFDQDGEDRFPDHVVELNHTSPPHTFSTCHSLPSLEVQGSSPVCRSMQHGSKSVENLCSLDMKTGYLDGGGIHSRMSVHQYRTASSRDIPQTSVAVGEGVHSVSGLREECVIFGANKEWEDTDFMTRCRNHIFNNKFNDDCASHNLNVSLDGWREPEIDGINHVNIKMEEMFGECHESNNRNFNIKRIEEWIRQIDIHESGIVQEVGESSSSIPKKKKDYHLITGVNASKLCAKGSGFEAAYNYISSLAPASTSAQMTSLGLVVIPFLSAFSCLKVLNLSCNAIVKITSGALPRGLHMLNLSRNNISTIEGLRELTRLRVLDLSYNRIVRIGHGLAACSSLKELYLAGNKIGEVEGLHRLLKLNVLDLQFNKISTAKCLGQLAANYASLQVINLEGNPAQRNVGEEQLKRYLLSLLPHLAYFNKHIIRATSTKELSDRSNHSASSRQFDRGMRSDHKRSRRGNHTAVSHKMTSSSNHFRPGQAVGSSPKPSRHRERHVQHLPPVGSKIYHLPRIDSKLFSSLQPINPMRRSRSEGNF